MKWIIALLLIPAALFSQKVKKINNKVTREKYYVLKSDTSVRHGRYEMFNSKGDLLVYGFYKNGKRDSVWYEFSKYNLKLISNGTYLDNEKVGIWKYPQSNALAFDHTLNKIVSYDSTFISINPMNFKSDTISAIYIGGTMEEGISENLMYPEDAYNQGIQGTVKLKITIDIRGVINKFEIIQSVSQSIDKETINVLSSLRDQWIPAIRKSDGQPVEFTFIIPITFRLAE